MAAIDEEHRVSMLDGYYKEVHATMLAYQSHTLGLFPRGVSRHARVRDNVFCAMALWSLSLAYRQVGDDHGRTHELEQTAIKCMRGILFCYMRQADKVEQFKLHQSSEDALHVRFNYITGDHVTEDEGWGHLQIDCTGLYLLMLAQMTASGLQIVFTMDEVDFIQNLVYYVERAYRISDFGMWERGSRENVGQRELHASSIGMAKSALEAMNGLNLFGDNGSSLSIIHVDPDAQYRNCVTLETLLPRESNSKETDASLLCITGFPGFAIDNPTLCRHTEQQVKVQLEGSHGFKRFLRDGHHSVKEDTSKKYYDPTDLSLFEGIECEYPFFFLLMVITELCRGNTDKADKYWERAKACVMEVNLETNTLEHHGHAIFPRLYFVPESEFVEDGRAGSVISMGTLRETVYRMEPLLEKEPFLMAQAIFFTAKLMKDGLVTVTEVDPLGLHLPHHARHRGMARHLGFKATGQDTVIQVALIAETNRLQTLLATHGIPTQTQKQVEPIKIRAPGEVLMKIYSRIGANKKLQLTGRPERPVGALGTSKVYRIFGHTVVCYPTDSMSDFYTSFDVMMLIDVIKYTLLFLNLYWNMSGRPTLCLYLTEKRLMSASNFKKFVQVLAAMRQGQVDGIKVRLDRLQVLIPSSFVEHLDCSRDNDLDVQMRHKLLAPMRSRSSVHHLSCSVSSDDASSVFNDGFESSIAQLEEEETAEEEPAYGPAALKTYSDQHLKSALKKETNPLGELYILHELMHRGQKQVDMNVTIEDRVEELYEQAGAKKHWMTVRLAAAILRKVVDCLAPSLTSMLVRGKELTVGIFQCPEFLIREPLSPKEIVKAIYDHCMPCDSIEAVLQQEIIINLADLITSSSSHKSILDGMLRLRIGWIIQAMKNEKRRIDTETSLQQMAPYAIKKLLLQVLQDDDSRSPLSKRQLNGALNRVPRDFYGRVFRILEKLPAITVREKTLQQLPTVHELSAKDKHFALHVEELLSSIHLPEYRQMIVELLMVVSAVVERNPELSFQGTLDLDVLLQGTITLYRDDSERKASEQKSTETSTEDSTEDTDDGTLLEEYSTSYVCHRVDSFYTTSPDGQFGSASYMAKAVLNRMLQEGIAYDPGGTCLIS